MATIESTDPIHYENGFWYFWDETWSHEYGPHYSREEAEAALKFYCENYLGDLNG